jgi:hypothetical protein
MAGRAVRTVLHLTQSHQEQKEVQPLALTLNVLATPGRIASVSVRVRKQKMASDSVLSNVLLVLRIRNRN